MFHIKLNRGDSDNPKCTKQEKMLFFQDECIKTLTIKEYLDF